MLDILSRAESFLAQYFKDRDFSKLKDLYVDYHHPMVERLWMDWEGYRIYLHCIHPCEPGEALYHPHPWPSAIHILDGKYEMGLGYGKENPPIAATIVADSGTQYEMLDPDGWHYVRPILEPSYSIMVTGKPWGREFPKPTKELSGLSPERRSELIEIFDSYIRDLDFLYLS